jgi:uncharacterized protein GlcG (DUF336 family)
MKVSVNQAVISSEAANVVVTAAVARARELNILVNVGVADSGGNLAAFLRMPGAFLQSIDIAIDKAYTAAGFGFPTSGWQEALPEGSLLREGILQRPRLVAFGGGVPIKVNGEVIGAIGVSGGTEEEDEQCALAGIAALV